MTHHDLHSASVKQVQQLRMVEFEEWFLAERDPRAAEGFQTVLHEDFYMA